jgi:hypothetical protein
MSERKSASEMAKAGGLPSLNYMQQMTGIRRNTLDLWNRDRPQLFDVMVRGCRVEPDPMAPMASCTWKKAPARNIHYRPGCRGFSLAVDASGMNFCPYCGGRLVINGTP